MLTPLLYGYNNPDMQIKFIIGDFPILIYFDHLAWNVELIYLISLFKKYALELQNNNTIWDPLLFAKDKLIKPKMKYMAELLRQTCTFSDRVVVLV